MRINGGDGTEGFAVKDGKLEWDEKMGFGGWLGKLAVSLRWTRTDWISVRLVPQCAAAVLSVPLYEAEYSGGMQPG